MQLKIVIQRHTVVPDSPDFVVYGLEIKTEISRTVIPKRYSELYQFQKELCYFAHFPLENDTCFLDLVPKLPPADWPNSLSGQFIEVGVTQKRRTLLEGYMQAVASLYQTYSTKEYPWVMLLETFLQIPQIKLLEKCSARRIQRAYHRYKFCQCEKALAK